MITKKLSLLAIATALFASACSEDSHTISSSMTESDDSFANESFESSSSLSTRLDINYRDTVKAGDTMNIYMEIEGKKGCNEDVLCLKERNSTVPLFLGKLTKGTLISVNAATSGTKNDTIFVRNEFGEILKVLEPIHDSKKDVDTYGNFMIPGSGAEMATNKFVVFNDGYYYLNLNAKFDSTSHMRLNVEIDSAYYQYIGDTSSVDIDIDKTVRGIVKIGNAPQKMNFKFTASTGYSIGIVVNGEWISRYELLDKKENVLASDTGSLDQLLYPEDSSSWTLSLRPLNVENYYTGPYATFEIKMTSRKLGQGEYFAFPDSVKAAGDTLTIVRPKNNQAKYYLRQEQYVWLADLDKGDTINVYQLMEGYYDTKLNPPSYEILDKKGDSIATIDAYKHGFKAKSKGPVYLHYLSTLPYAVDEKEELTFHTFIQRPGSLDSIAFYNENKDKEFHETTVNAGDTVWFDNFSFHTYPGDTPTSTKMKWFVPCEDIPILGNAAYITSIDNCKIEQEISASYLIVQNDVSGDDHARLIAESLADPLMRDTLSIRVNVE